jgi:hypothetical protein
MGAQFFCSNAARRVLLLQQSTLNGIDYLEVADSGVPTGITAQQTLMVRFLLPLTTTLDITNIRIEGGVRYPNVKATTVQNLKTAWPTLSAAVQAYYAQRFASDDERSHVLIVNTDSYGDFSTYTLYIQTSLANPAPPANLFDLKLSQIDFSFKVECPSPFDCAATTLCPPAPVTAPAIDYLAKDYSSFLRVMLDRISSVSTSWTERNPADAGMVIVEALAAAADSLSYYQDAVATEAYLGTARRRISVRRHARLLDYHMHEGSNARAFVAVEVDPTIQSLILPRTNPDGTTVKYLTRVTDGTAQIAPNDRLLQSVAPRIFEAMHDTVLLPGHNRISFYTWGDENCCLLKGATRATLLNDPSFPLALMPGDVLVFEEWISSETGLAVDADRGHRQAVRLTYVSSPATRAEDQPGAARQAPDPVPDPLTPKFNYVDIEWHDDDALNTPFCISMTNKAGVFVGDMAGARGNILLADHGQTLVEPLSPATFDDPLRYRPYLSKPQMTHAYTLSDPTSPSLSAVATLTQDPHVATPCVTLAPDWHPKNDLLGSTYYAHEFVVEMDENGFAQLRFGDGKLGAKPDPDLIATYRVGRGLLGNVGSEAIVQVMTSITGITNVRNPLPAMSGVDPESITAVQQYAPQAFRVQQRAVTEADYATIAMRYPEVQRAVASRRWTGSWYTVYLTIERVFGRAIDQTFRDGLTAFVEGYRLAGEDLEISPPVYVPLNVQLVICCADGYFRDNVEKALLQIFSSSAQADGTPGFFAPGQFVFGQPVYLSQLVQKAMSVPGVQWVDTDPTNVDFVFQRANQSPAGEIQQGFISMGTVEIAQCMSSPSQPESGQLTLVMQGGL